MSKGLRVPLRQSIKGNWSDGRRRSHENRTVGVRESRIGPIRRERNHQVMANLANEIVDDREGNLVSQ
jgi:hypothetical protein